jgi:hypothetical protein
MDDDKTALQKLLEWIKEEQRRVGLATNPYVFDKELDARDDGMHEAYQSVIEEIERMVRETQWVCS